MIRPRRFGKSLWLSILESYYDVAFEDRFEELFGKYYIGQHPTSERNKYLILSFNFAGVSPDIDRLEQSFWGHLDLTIWPEQELGKGYCDLWMAPNLVNHLGMKYTPPPAPQPWPRPQKPFRPLASRWSKYRQSR